MRVRILVVLRSSWLHKVHGMDLYPGQRSLPVRKFRTPDHREYGLTALTLNIVLTSWISYKVNKNVIFRFNLDHFNAIIHQSSKNYHVLDSIWLQMYPMEDHVELPILVWTNQLLQIVLIVWKYLQSHLWSHQTKRPLKWTLVQVQL